MLKVIGAVTTLALAVACPAWASSKERGPGDAGDMPATQKDHAQGRQGSSQDEDHAIHGHDGVERVKAARLEARGPQKSTPAAKALAQRGLGISQQNAIVRDVAAPVMTWTNNSAQRFATIGACPPGLARKKAGCPPPGLAKKSRSDGWGRDYRPDYFGVPVRGGGDYVYYNGYLIPTGGRAAYIPLLGGALAVGQLWPERYPFMPLADWQNRFYGFDDPDQYRFTDNVIYRVEPETSAIASVVALLTGSDFTVGSPLPPGFDVYNVPTAFRSRYADSEGALYRYADGRIYQIDPTSMLIARAIDLVQ